MKRILIIEDEEKIARFIELELKYEGYEVTKVFNGRDGLEMVKIHPYDLILLDIMLPELNGIGVLRRIRQFSDIPIILLTARDEVMDKVAGLDGGANDYVTKPFAIEELLARIRVNLKNRKSLMEESVEIKLGPLKLNIETREVYINDKLIYLTKREFDLLHLIFLARGDSNTIVLNKVDFNISDLVREVVKEANLIDPNHKFQVIIEEESIVNGDRQLMKQALRILLDNSIKYTPWGEEIKFKVYNRDEKVHIMIQDSGIGIKSENLPSIFDRFYRSDESRAKETGGTGLGLSISKWIIESHGAYFEVISRENIGTRITIIMP